MDIKTEAKHTGAFLLSECCGQISREAVTVIAGAALPAGQVLGIVSVGGKYAPYDAAAVDGTDVAVGVLYAPLAVSDADRPAVVVARLAEVAGELLVGLDLAANADLKSRYIIVR